MDNKGIVNILDSKGKSFGTGFYVFFNEKNYILTCYHVLSACGSNAISNDVAFRFNSKETIHCAKLLAFDNSHDLALLESNISSDTYYSLSSNGKKGEKLGTMGFPNHGTVGIVAEPYYQELIDNNKHIQLDNANTITCGFSGAPLICKDGSVIGIVTSIPNDSHVRQSNIACATPSEIILETFSAYLITSNTQTKISDHLTGVEREKNYLEKLIAKCENFLTDIGILVELSGKVEMLSSNSNVVNPDHPLPGFRQPYAKRSRKSNVNQRYEKEQEGNNPEVVDNIWSCIESNTQKVVLLGEPGSGKTVSAVHLAIDYAKRALEDSEELIPILIPLGSFKDDTSFDEYIKSENLFGLANEGYSFNKDRFIFILDAFNELNISNKNKVVSYISNLKRFVISCRLLDYKKDFSQIQNL